MLDTIERTNDTASIAPAEDIASMMGRIGRNAREAATALAAASTERKHAALIGMADAMLDDRAAILEANAIDMENGRARGLAASFLDRLNLDEGRIRTMAAGVRDIAALPDPVGRELARWTRPNGLEICRVATPLGVIGVIYESRPNVTADAGALCLWAGNAVILRGGTDSYHSSRAIHAALVKGLRAGKLPEAAISLVPTTDRAAVGEMLRGLDGSIDVIVPRGGKGLVARVQEDARVPVFAHLEGLVHIYIDASADPGMAVEVVSDAKMRRTGICGAAETLLVDRARAERLLPPILDALHARGCEIRGDATTRALWPKAKIADEEDWATEYLDAIIAVRVVDGVEGAISHVRQYSSGHTEAVIADDRAVASRFMGAIDSAILLHNASTQFADGGEFGMGAEIGIATGKMHARGPVGVEQLTSFNYRVGGSGQVRG